MPQPGCARPPPPRASGPPARPRRSWMGGGGGGAPPPPPRPRRGGVDRGVQPGSLGRRVEERTLARRGDPADALPRCWLARQFRPLALPRDRHVAPVEDRRRPARRETPGGGGGPEAP